MSKQVTISSLVRQAARSEAEFVAVLNQIFAEEDAERIGDFFDRLNVPRSVLDEGLDLTGPLPEIEATHTIESYEAEKHVSDGMQKYLERHLKKIKWHAQHPSVEGARNALLITRGAMIVTSVRLTRLHKLLGLKDELTPQEWWTARELINRTYLTFRHFLLQVGGAWVDAMSATADREELENLLGNFYELIDGLIRRLEEHRNAIEDRRMELTVLPPGLEPVKPPVYFGGDLMGKGPWQQFWRVMEDRSHHFREALA
jgi:hypothetical protein